MKRIFTYYEVTYFKVLKKSSPPNFKLFLKWVLIQLHGAQKNVIKYYTDEYTDLKTKKTNSPHTNVKSSKIRNDASLSTDVIQRKISEKYCLSPQNINNIQYKVQTRIF